MLTQDDREAMRQRAAEADTLAFALGRAHCDHVAKVLGLLATDVRVALSHLARHHHPPAPPPGFNDSEGDEAL